MFEQDSNVLLSHDEIDRLYVTWLSNTDFAKLKEAKNQDYLKSAWQNVKKEVYPYFRDYKHSLDDISRDFGQISLTIDPNIAFCYNQESNRLEFNVLDLFYISCPDKKGNNFVATLPWKLGGLLIHEYDHMLFFKENDLICKRGKEVDEFGNNHIEEIESRAFHNQIAYLENAKKNAPSRSIINFLNVDCWTTDGKPSLNRKSYSYVLSKFEFVSKIDEEISFFEKIIKNIDKNYTELGNKHNKKLSLKKLKILSLPIALNPRKCEYPTIEFDM
jgi:hypothetical protein